MGASVPVHAGWEVQWIDSFDGDSVDWRNWTAQTKANYNNEVQCYTADDYSPERNYDVSDGTLKIIARKKLHSCPTLGGQTKSWTSGRLNSKDKREFLYGRIESRIRFHNLERGTWPAFWMLENRIAEQPIKGDGDNVGWPNPGAGEIDVWEWFSNSPNSYITNFYNASGCGSEYRYPYPRGAQDVLDWHKYAIEWTPDKIDFYMNDTLVVSQNIQGCRQYQEPMFVLLNVAMGGNLGGTIEPSLQRATMEVDYIAHCQFTEDNDANFCDQDTPRSDDLIPDVPLPELKLTLTQANRTVDVIEPFAGDVKVMVDMDLSDEQKTDYSLFWQVDDIPSPVMEAQTLTFDPSSMLDGDYEIGALLEHVTNESLNNRTVIIARIRSDEDATPPPSVSVPSNGSSGGSSSLPYILGLFLLALSRHNSRKIWI
ncbi:glycoside hydrolase family 16 protein [Vibrio comitans]